MNNSGQQRRQGRFITIEGSEGSGKTTSIAFIRQWFEKKGIHFILTREPGGTPLAERLREVLLHPETSETIDPVSELLMIFAARRQHICQVIQPALDEGKVVICDRFTDTTWAYQGGGRQLRADWIGSLETMVQGTLRPDLTLLLDLPVREGLKRAEKRSDPDRFEREHIIFFERIRNAYLSRAEQFPTQYRVIDASLSIEQVNEALAMELNHFLQRS